MMTDTQMRFLRAIADHVPLERVAELHLFPARRQGTMESGVAVIAVERLESPSPSHTVYSASYKLTLKGAERGRWETDIVDEADAPLVTVDEVVRGVQRRSGEGQEEPERVSGDRLRELLLAYVAPPPAATWQART
jgi:hypothetical protein